VQESDPNSFARFEAIIFFSYSLVALGVWVLIHQNYSPDDPGLIYDMLSFSNETTYIGALYSTEPNFPISFNQTEIFWRQMRLAEKIWQSSGVVFVTVGICAIVQAIGLYFAVCGRVNVWMGGVKVMLYVQSFVVPFYIFIIYQTTFAVNIAHNILGFILMPACIQYGFAVYFAITSDVWAMAKGEGAFQYYLSLFGRLAPLVLFSLFMLGLSLNRAEMGSAGLILMALSGVIGMAAASIFLLFVCNEAIGFFFDWLQLMNERFFPAVQEAVGNVIGDVEEGVEEAPTTVPDRSDQLAGKSGALTTID